MDKITIIEQAALAGRPIGFDYIRSMPVGRGQVETWTERRQLVPDPDEPVRYNARGEAYVIGDDLARGGPRSFTLDKIAEVSVA